VRLSELSPIWLDLDGKRVGFTFLCPHCKVDRLTCFGTVTPFRDQVKLMCAVLGTDPEERIDWVPSRGDYAWQLSNLDNFETLSVTPSIDASASGNWHGHITNGEIR